MRTNTDGVEAATRRAKPRLILSAFMALLVAATLMPVSPASAIHDSTSPSPSGSNCKWYGSAVATHDVRVDREGSWQTNHTADIGWSTASSDGTCRGRVHSTFRLDAGSDAGECYYAKYDGTVPARYEAFWNSSGGFSVGFFGGEDLVREEGYCGDVPVTRMVSVGVDATCDVPGVDTDAERKALQAVVVHCTQHD